MAKSWQMRQGAHTGGTDVTDRGILIQRPIYVNRRVDDAKLHS